MLEFKENEKIKNRYLTAILNNTDCGMIYTDSEGKISHYNSMGNRLFSNKVYIDDNIFDFVQEVDREFILELRNEVKNILIDTKKEKVSMDITPVQQSENKNSFLFIFRRFKNIEESANILRKSLVNVEFSAKHTWKDLVTCNKNFEEVKKIAKHYAETENTILITGESGTGKELFAQSIHNESRRRGESFVAFNCANISENLIESELFGYEEGAFTGARRRGKKGLFELADKGTIFLDEISEIPYHLQNKFLRVLQEKCFRRVGGEDTIYVDVRVIAATNKDLSLLCDKGEFRTDLFYRLNVLEVETIPLRKRKEDIVITGKHILEKELLGLNLFEADSKYTIEEFVSKRQELSRLIFQDLKDDFEEYGLAVSNVSIVNHDFSMEYEKAIEAKKVAEQTVERSRFEQEKFRVEAENKVKLAEYQLKEKELQAKANQVEATSLSPLLLKKLAIEKWDGKLPQVNGAGANTLIDIKTK